jgi:hypothetical protein
MRVIIAGSRGCPTWLLVRRAVRLSEFEVTEVVSGTARGVDQFGEKWARKNNIPIKRFQADWDKFGKRAGYLRNQEMAHYADALVAVWDEHSKGTKHMVSLMLSESKAVYVLKYPSYLNVV